MSKNAKTLIILTVVLAVLAGAYIAVTTLGGDDDPSVSAAPELFASDIGAAASLSYTDGETTLSFTLENDVWRVTDDPAFPLDQDAISKMITAFTATSAVRAFDTPDNLDEFGLDPAAYTVTLTEETGGVYTLKLGGQIGENIYAMTDDPSMVYTVSTSITTTLDFDRMNLIVLDTLPKTDKDALQSVTLRSDTLMPEARTLILVRTEDGWGVGTNASVTPVEDFVFPGEAEKSPSDYVGGVLTALTSAEFSSCAYYAPDNDTLDATGLIQPALTVRYTYTETDTEDAAIAEGTVEIGAALEDGTGYYARTDNAARQICVLPGAVVDPLLEALATMGQ